MRLVSCSDWCDILRVATYTRKRVIQAGEGKRLGHKNPDDNGYQGYVKVSVTV